ncbi:TrkH family potassium uptake protein [Arenibaculum pallidiluteum]|uniref:TrkH family potassium uptake protein n=1 Tax=Arenibaculum pallidiluteum TaxID=2812559 RepID=UPI001A9597B0|nr:TrkH family potassium uptake protein [Arenibaculum pallidiluteum]
MLALDTRPVLYVAGWILAVLAISMLAPMVVDIAAGHGDWVVFGTSAMLTLFFAVVLVLTNWTPGRAFNTRQLFLLTSLAWILVSVFAALPFAFGMANLSVADAFFESVSGLTTTGSTVITGLDSLPPGLLLWRALTQWLGGIGIIGMGIAILPFLRVGGMQLFRSESSDRSDKVLPRAGDIAAAIGWTYIVLTVFFSALLALGGMSVFDAICHTMAAISTGGFSNYDASMGHFNEPWLHWIVVLAMVVGGMPLVRLISFAKGDYGAIHRDSQIRWYLIFLTVVTLGLAVWLSLTGTLTGEAALRHAAFNVVSVVTTTGFASIDYTLWGPLSSGAFLILTVVGGCTGSTAGGIKIFRFEILFMVLRAQIQRQFSPNRVIPLTYQDKPVNAEVMISVMSFGFVFGALLLLTALGLTAYGLDLVTAVSGSATAYANVGPGLGAIIGPAGNFSTLPDGAKWLLSLAMLLGRLEFFTMLVLLSPGFWRA